MRKLYLLLTLGIGALSLTACGGGIDLGTVDLDLSGPYEHVRFSGNLENADGLPTIIAFRVLLDGNPAQTAVLAQPATAAGLAGSWIGGKGGQRRLRIFIDQQTVSPSLYRITSLTVEHVNTEGRVTSRVELDPRTASLATGEAIEWVFRL
jgi:hypothetical protein